MDTIASRGGFDIQMKDLLDTSTANNSLAYNLAVIYSTASEHSGMEDFHQRGFKFDHQNP